ncbi:MAG TPA: amino acid adenylation domain-containing protein [Gemmatimonadales bacterium]|nr:amino acid adenylation domain-containing protein [Gemmatimonadales bacterium]
MTVDDRTPGGSSVPDDDLDLLASMLAEEGFESAADGPIPSRAFDGPVPAAFAQELVWLLDRATPGNTAYQIPLASRLTGRLDEPALRQAFDTLIARHESLRTTFAPGGAHPVQIVHPPRPMDLIADDLRALPASEREIEATRRLTARMATPFDLSRDQLLRGMLLRVAEDEYLFLLETHHIVADGWSTSLLIRELSVLYEGYRAGHPAELPPLAVHFRDFAAWQRERLSGARLEELLVYWRAQLADAPSSLELPTDRPRPAVPSFEGNEAIALLPTPVLEQLKQLAQAHGATLYMVLLAAYQTVLHRWSGQSEILTGSAIAGRTRPELEGVFGYLANTLVLHGSFGDDPSFTTLLERTRDRCLGAFDHQEIPLEKLILELKRDQAANPAPLFQVVLTMQDTRPALRSFGDLTVSSLSLGVSATKFDLTLFPAERPEGLRLVLHYRSDLFEPETAARFLSHLTTLLTAVVATPEVRVSEVALMSALERAALSGWNATATPLGAPTTVGALVAAAAARRPAGAAVVAGDTVLSWAALQAQASRLAHHLQAQGVGPEVPVGLCLERSAELIVGMLGILWSGGAYVPLLPELPPARLQQQLDASGVRLVVTLAAHRDRFPADLALCCLDADAATLGAAPDTPPASGATPDSLAYVLFTSGSTGTPKGVAVTHANLVHYTRAIAAVLELPLDGSGTPWHCGTVSTLAADLGHTSVFPALVSGGTLHVLPAEVGLDAARFQACVAAQPLDLLKITPSHFQALAGPDFAPAHLPRRWLVLGGEPCPWPLVEAVRAAGRCRVLNHYGPTETTVGATTFEAGSTDLTRWAPVTVPIGRPLPNVTALVLDARQQPVPVGVPGELWIGGAGVARGYLGAAALTAERFAGSAEARRYRTGDRVRRLPSGDLEFLGRLDTQVKVRGNRVELGEIDAVLARHPAVRQAVVTLRDDSLTGYVVLDPAVEDSALVAHLRAALPEYMVPAAWVRLERLPLTANGKIDRAALPAPMTALPPAEDPTPRNATERALATLWAEILRRDAVGRGDNFFALGGHSLLAIRLLGRIAKQFGVRLSLRILFEHPTIATLAPLLDHTDADSTGSAAPRARPIERRSRGTGEPTSPDPAQS